MARATHAFTSMSEKSWFHCGDDFVIGARRKHAYWLKDVLGKAFILKDRGCIGPRARDCKEIIILNRGWVALALWKPNGLDVRAGGVDRGAVHA